MVRRVAGLANRRLSAIFPGLQPHGEVRDGRTRLKSGFVVEASLDGDGSLRLLAQYAAHPAWRSTGTPCTPLEAVCAPPGSARREGRRWIPEAPERDERSS